MEYLIALWVVFGLPALTIWAVIRSALRIKRKKQAPPWAAQSSARPAGGKAPKAQVGNAADARLQQEFPHLFNGAPAAPAPAAAGTGRPAFVTPEGTDPCHDGEASGAYVGSLGAAVMEGEDPCHDALASGAYTGSLGPVAMEGEDPCHAEPARPAKRNREKAPAPAAKEPENPGPSWSGSEVVQGFIYSEVLGPPRSRAPRR